MLKKIIFFPLFALIIACGKIEPKGNIKNTDIPLEKFDKIELSGKFRLFIVPNEKDFINVETYENIGENLSIKVENATLHIEEKRPVGNVDFYNLTLYSNTFPKQITMKDSLEMNISGRLNGEEILLKMENYSKLIGAINVKKIKMELKGNTKANLLGTANKMTLKTQDSANIISPYFKINSLDIIAKNATYTELDATDTITGSIEGNSKFLYYSDPIRAFKIDKKAKVTNGTLK